MRSVKLLAYASTVAVIAARAAVPPPQPAAPINLAISLVFGAGQVVVGGALARHGLGGQRWHRPPRFALALLGLWVMCSGVAELIVSGLETVARLWGGPSPGAIAAVRGVADASLFGAALALVAVFALYLARIWWRTVARTHHDRAP